MKDKNSSLDSNDKSDQDCDSRKSVLTWKNILHTIGFLWVPAIVIILILKLIGC